MLLAAAAPDSRFVELEVSPLAWLLLIGGIFLLLGIDLYRHREAHEPSSREALAESIAWVVCGLLFGVVISAVYGGAAFGEYVSGYLIEKSLSVDNVFVWSILFASLSIPVKYQHRVLFWGIFGALAFRAAFILLGTALITRFWWVLLVFGVFLIFTGAKVIRHRADEGEAEATRGTRILRRFIPVSDEFDGQRFLTRINGRLVATPLLAALIVVEITDVIFAVDSVPAILAVSREPFLVFASNAFAILGLRAMYFLLANARQRFHYLPHALGGILIFVGAKMTVSRWFHLDTFVSLAIIFTMIVAAIGFSLHRARKAEDSSSPVDAETKGAK